MKIERLKLTNFRNYTNLEISFVNNINLIIGDNGQGKTNILESVYMLSLTKSNRIGVEENLIKFNEEVAHIEGIVRNKDNLVKKQEIHLTKNKKQLFINNKEIRRSKDYVANLCVISFTPQDLEIVKGSPLERRNMMNIDISQLYNNYISYLNEYNQVIKMRNEYLKIMSLNGNKDSRYLDVINANMVEKALKIYEYRFGFIERINKYLANIYKKITGLPNLKIKYLNSMHVDCYDSEELRKKYEEKIKKNFNLELMQGMSLIGPHRDDFSFSLDGIDMKLFSSQGQQRMAIIALKIAEIYLFKDVKGEYPVLLLDDIFSEIDTKKRNNIIKFLNDDIQSIITTTDINDIENDLLNKAQVFIVKNNMVKKRRGKISK